MNSLIRAETCFSNLKLDLEFKFKFKYAFYNLQSMTEPNFIAFVNINALLPLLRVHMIIVWR